MMGCGRQMLVILKVSQNALQQGRKTRESGVVPLRYGGELEQVRTNLQGVFSNR